MSSTTSSAPLVINWTLLGDQVTTTQQRIEQTKVWIYYYLLS